MGFSEGASKQSPNPKNVTAPAQHPHLPPLPLLIFLDPPLGDEIYNFSISFEFLYHHCYVVNLIYTQEYSLKF